MEDSNDTSLAPEIGTTTNVAEVADSALPATEAVETQEPSTVRDAVLKAFEKTSATQATTALPKQADNNVVNADPAKETDPITGRELEPIRAPGSMTPSLREKWNTVPRDYQKFWVDRERDMQIKLQETAHERKIADEFTKAVAPYEDMLRQHNTNAVSHAKELFNLDHQLRTGNGEVKAQIIHSLISHFKPDMQALVSLANGQVSRAAPQQTPDVQALVRQEMEAQTRSQQEAKQDAEVQSAMTKFASDSKNEFLEDLKPMMAKAIEAGFVQGNDFEELFRNAYDFAASQHPEVKQILASRGAAMVTNAPTPQARPVQSVKPSLSSGGRGTQSHARPKSLREAAEMAWNKHSPD